MIFVFIHAAEIVLLVALSLSVSKIRGRRFDPFEPYNVVNAMFLLYYFIRPLFLMIADPAYAYLPGNPARPSDFAWATGYAVLGLFCFHIGYFALKDQPAAARVNFWIRSHVSQVAVIGGIIGLASVAAGVFAAGGISSALSGTGNLRLTTAGWGYAILGTCFFPIVTLLLFVDHLLGRSRKLLIAIFGTINIVWAAQMGNRTGMFALIVSCVAVYAYIRKFKSWPRFMLKAALAGVIVVPVIVFWSQARDLNMSVLELGNVAATVLDKDPRVFPAAALGEFSAVDAHAAIIHGGASIFPFQYGKTYADVALFLIPRSVWPDKPAAFSNSVGYYLAGNDRWDIPPGVIGELYINFHWPGIALGMFLLGLGMAALHRRLMRSYGSKAFYCMLLPYFGVFLSRNFIGGGVLLLTTVLPMWPAVRYIQKGGSWADAFARQLPEAE